MKEAIWVLVWKMTASLGYWRSCREASIKSAVPLSARTHIYTPTLPSPSFPPAPVIVTYISCATVSVWPLTVATVSAVRTPTSPVESGSADMCACVCVCECVFMRISGWPSEIFCSNRANITLAGYNLTRNVSAPAGNYIWVKQKNPPQVKKAWRVTARHRNLWVLRVYQVK